MARWCPTCGRPKEKHEREQVMVNSVTGMTPVNQRRCVLKRVKRKDAPYPIFRAKPGLA